MKPVIYYTIITYRTFCMVQYAISPACKISTFPGTFDDPGEASREFKAAMQGNLEYLTPGVFEHKTSFLSARYLQDMARLADWNSGKAIRI